MAPFLAAMSVNSYVCHYFSKLDSLRVYFITYYVIINEPLQLTANVSGFDVRSICLSGTLSVSLPHGLALDHGTGRVYLTDVELHTVSYYDTSTQRITTLITGSNTDRPRDIVLDTAGR